MVNRTENRGGFYAFARFIVVSFFRLGFRWRVEGAHHLPATGPVVIGSNHIGVLDPPLIGASMHRYGFFMAKEELFRSKPAAALIRRLGAIPVRRGGADRTAVKTSIQVVSEGHCLVVFPEGHRSQDGRLGKGQPGIALIAKRAQALIVPTAIVGPYRFRGPLTVRFGEPFPASQDDSNEVLMETLMLRIQELLDAKHV